MLLRADAGGSGRGGLKEVRFIVVLLGGGIYRMLAPLWILIEGYAQSQSHINCARRKYWLGIFFPCTTIHGRMMPSHR